MRELTAKEEAFIEAYLGDDDCRFNATKSVLRAGYAEKNAHVTGSIIIKKPRIVAKINERIAKAEKQVIATYAEKIRLSWNLLMKCYESEDAPNFVKLLQELNKMQGHYSPEKIAITNLNVDTDIQTLKKTMDDLRLTYNRDY